MSSSYHTQLFIAASQTGDVQQIERLTPLVDPSVFQLALKEASAHGHVACVRLLIPILQHNEGEALRWAAMEGHAECVRLLIPVSDPKVRNSQPLLLASRDGYSECVKLLIPVSNAKDNNSRALYCAVLGKHTECIDLLYPVSEPLKALQALKTQYPASPHVWGDLALRIEADAQRTLLQQVVHHIAGSKGQRKM